MDHSNTIPKQDRSEPSDGRLSKTGRVGRKGRAQLTEDSVEVCSLSTLRVLLVKATILLVFESDPAGY